MGEKLEKTDNVNGQENINIVLIAEDQKVSLKNNIANMVAKNKK
jgi:hypothetical protein